MNSSLNLHWPVARLWFPRKKKKENEYLTGIKFLINVNVNCPVGSLIIMKSEIKKKRRKKTTCQVLPGCIEFSNAVGKQVPQAKDMDVRKEDSCIQFSCDVRC